MVDGPPSEVIEVSLKLKDRLPVAKMAENAVGTGPVGLAIASADDLPAVRHGVAMERSGLADVGQHLL